MCNWCETYGNGEKWFLSPENMARNLYRPRTPKEKSADKLKVRGMGVDPAVLLEARHSDPEKYERMIQESSEAREKIGLIQIINLEEAKAIVERTWPIAAMMCVCRRSTRGLRDEENMWCLALGPGMYKWERWPQRYHGGVQYLSPEEAKAWLERANKKGWVHIADSYGTPFVGGICNCEYPECEAIRGRIDYGVSFPRKGHYVYRVNYDNCNACGICGSRCQFKALNIDVGRGAAHIDMKQCFGCGLCQTACKRDAIYAVERENIQGLANNW